MLQMIGDVYTRGSGDFLGVTFRVTAQFISVMETENIWINFPLSQIVKVVTVNHDISYIPTRPRHDHDIEEDELPF